MGYPQWIYHRVEEPKIIDSDELGVYLAEGWAATPAVFKQSWKERKLRERLAQLQKEVLIVMDEIGRLADSGENALDKDTMEAAPQKATAKTPKSRKGNS